MKVRWEEWLAAYAASSIMVGTNLDVAWDAGFYSFSSISQIVESIVLMIIGSFTGAVLADIFGRRRVLLVASIFVIPRLIDTYLITDESKWMNIRFVFLGSGITSVVVPLYIAEISSVKNRGNLMSIQQSVYLFGIFSSHIVLALSSCYPNAISLEIMRRGLLITSTLFHAAMIWSYPETPDYLNWKKRWEEAAKSLAVFKRIEMVRSRRQSPQNLRISSYLRNKDHGWREGMKEIVKFQNRRSLAIIFSLVVIRRASGQDRNAFVLGNMMWEYPHSTEHNYVPVVSYDAASFIFSIFAMWIVHLFRKKVSLLSVIFVSFIATVIGMTNLMEHYWIFAGVIFTQYLAHLIFISITLAYTGEFFLINVRSIAIAAVISFEVLTRLVSFLIDNSLIGGANKSKYEPIHSYFNCASLFAAFFFVLIFFPRINKVPSSEIKIEISEDGESAVVEKFALR